ncbi:septum formation protein [Rhodoligotrophos appendicifer]|uniref:Maf family nucleotide pyrophosphatase n=1 Tax=Rhodoligotrophos appendicifer TaxID=987056 RepID=UPI001187011D|nr:Maf family nucleotide pyrophosphatase [Rhodoligotrophos appendicifer]
MSEDIVKLVLASASPRRIALLEQAGLKADLIYPVDVDEEPRRREAPRLLAARLAQEKALAAVATATVRGLGRNVFVLAADTTVAVGRRNLGKTEDVDTAIDTLKLLSGRMHRVYTGVCVITPTGKRIRRLVETRVRFKRLSREDIDTYIQSEEWRGKAGCYALQGRAEAFVRALGGTYSNVVGLPLYETVTILEGAGYPVYFRWNQTPGM